MSIVIADAMKELSHLELASVSGGAEAEPSVYYDMGKWFGEAYAWARSETADYYEWVASL